MGVMAHWTSCALVDTTIKSKSRDMSEMFHKVLGFKAKLIFELSLFLLLCGAVGVYIVLTTEFAYELVGRETLTVNYRLLALCFAVVSMLLLKFSNMKALSYVSLIKVGVIVVALIVSAIYALPEINFRKDFVTNHSGTGTKPAVKQLIEAASVYPMTPTLFGLMKGLSPWMCSFIFHVGVNDMYASLQGRSMPLWRRCSKIAVTIVAVITLLYAAVGFLATSNQKMLPILNDMHADDRHAVRRNDLCSGHSGTFFGLYEENPVIRSMSAVLIVVLLLSYPLYFFFLKNLTLRLWKSIRPTDFEAYDETKRSFMASCLVWTLTLGFALIDNNPGKVLDLSTSFLSTIAVFLLPCIAWQKVHGGIGHCMTLGYLPFEQWTDCRGETSGRKYSVEKDEFDVESAKVVQEKTSNKTVIEKSELASSAAMLSLSSLFFVVGTVTSILNFAIPNDTQKKNPNFPWRIPGFDFEYGIRN